MVLLVVAMLGAPIYLISRRTSSSHLSSVQLVRRAVVANHAVSGASAGRQKAVSDLSERLSRATDTCRYGPARDDPEGKLALAEWDIAAAQDLENVSPGEEARIRASIGAEMGLAPSAVNGWKQIYQSRAERARRVLDEAKARETDTKLKACQYLPELARLLAEAKSAASVPAVP